jgi:hypothetical protein
MEKCVLFISWYLKKTPAARLRKSPAIGSITAIMIKLPAG